MLRNAQFWLHFAIYKRGLFIQWMGLVLAGTNVARLLRVNAILVKAYGIEVCFKLLLRLPLLQPVAAT